MIDFGRRTVVWFQNFWWEWQEFGKNEVIPKFSGICIMKWMWKWTPGNKFESHTSHWEEKEKKKKEKSMIENSTKILKEEIRSLNFKINFGEDVRLSEKSLWIESWIIVDWIMNHCGLNQGGLNHCQQIQNAQNYCWRTDWQWWHQEWWQGGKFWVMDGRMTNQWQDVCHFRNQHSTDTHVKQLVDPWKDQLPWLKQLADSWNWPTVSNCHEWKLRQLMEKGRTLWGTNMSRHATCLSTRASTFWMVKGVDTAWQQEQTFRLLMVAEQWSKEKTTKTLFRKSKINTHNFLLQKLHNTLEREVGPPQWCGACRKNRQDGSIPCLASVLT